LILACGCKKGRGYLRRGALLAVTALPVGVQAPRPQNVFSTGILRDREAVLSAGRDEYKGVFGVGKVDWLGLHSDVSGGFRVGKLVKV
jgi:hypothetical protein